MFSVLQIICDIVILIGGVTAAIVTIGKFFGGQFNFLKGRRRKLVEKDFEEILPPLLDKYMQEVYDELKEIKEINIKQSETIDKLVRGIRDTLRYQIMDIYQRYKKTRKIPQYEREKLDDTYLDYKELDGNHYIDKYYRRMEKWEVIPSSEEEEI